MKLETKVKKAQLQYLREIIQLKKPKTITSLAKSAGMSRHLVADVLRKLDPALYVKISSDTDVRLAFQIDFSKVNPSDYSDPKLLKFERFVSLLKAGWRNKTQIACELNCGRVTVYSYLKRFIEKYNELEQQIVAED